ncbi:hypothetical protein L211DRAFT_853406 [Terfezia boudieri ATCC MYA-4762]|uniref:Uncharacterized protein n=1 Tax=Terfezia boudieri ATCC MYA-4762 TaxID=1051890 RepID=A0A3N4LCL6_9PEZI|nr:hypothetical protein L211DRAFT_853406 [Terfezia boudieri ATCC MYA-4762]
MDAIGARDMTWSADGTDIFCLPQSSIVRSEDRRRVPCSAPTVPLAEELEVTDNSVNRATILAAADSLELTRLLAAIYAQHAAKPARATPRPDIAYVWTNEEGANKPWIPRNRLPAPVDNLIGDTIVVRPLRATGTISIRPVPLLYKPNEPRKGTVNVKPQAPKSRPVAKWPKPSQQRQLDDEMEEVIHVRSAPVATPTEEVIIVRYPQRSPVVGARPRGTKPLLKSRQ